MVGETEACADMPLIPVVPPLFQHGRTRSCPWHVSLCVPGGGKVQSTRHWWQRITLSAMSVSSEVENVGPGLVLRDRN